MDRPTRGQLFRNDAGCIDDLVQFTLNVDISPAVQGNETEWGVHRAEAFSQLRFDTVPGDGAS